MANSPRVPTPFSPQPVAGVADIPGQRRSSHFSGYSEGKKLIVGQDICLSGEITACDTLVVEGAVEASLSDSRVIEIAETGVFKGKVEIEIAKISGQFDGELTARDRLIIRGTGRVSGIIRYRQLEIESGGQIAGTVEVLESTEATNDSGDAKQDS
jgi:cytoskeletal protein CcmA (bactofilin family)